MQKNSPSELETKVACSLVSITELSIDKFVSIVAKRYSRWLDTKGRYWMVVGIGYHPVPGQGLSFEPRTVDLVDLNSEQSISLDLVEFRKYILENQFKRYIKALKPAGI